MKKMKHLLTIAILITISINGYGQVGIGTTTPSGALDVTSTNDGLVIPRVELRNSTSALPLTTPTTSELVYNTANVADVTPGYYYWDGAAWVRLATGSGSGVETDPKVGNLTANKIPRWNGTTLADGIVTDDGTTVTVAGKTSTTNFQMTNGAGSNLLLQSDTNGDARWVNANTLAITESDPQVTSTTTGRVPRWVGTTLLDGAIFDTGTSIGIGNTAPAGALDVTSTTDGLVIPRVALTSVSSPDPLTAAPTISELVYNITATGGLTPGYYYWDGTAWVRLATAKLTSSRVPRWDGTTLINGSITDNGNQLAPPPATQNPSANRVGINAPTPRASLEVNFLGTPDGLLIPRVALTSVSSPDPLVVPATSELVYNTTGTGGLTPGYYYWSGASWLRLLTPNDVSTINNVWSITGNTNVDGNSFIGTAAGADFDVAFRRNNVAGGRIGTSNTSFGLNAGNGLAESSNTAIGVRALDGLTSSASGSNTAVGFEALSASTGSAVTNCTAIGFQAGENITSIDNTAVGSWALFGGTNSERNTAVGSRPMEQQSGSDNTAVGFRALHNGSGAGNVAIGNKAGESHSIGSNCTMVGFQAKADGLTNATALGFGAIATSSNEITLGNASISALRCNAGVISALSDRRDKTDILKLAEGIEFIKKLKPVTYTWNTRDKSKVGSKAVGFIAQDLLDLQKNSAIGDNLDLVTYSNPDRLEARYGNLLPVIVKGMQEQQELIEALQKSNAELLKANAAILERLERLEKR